MGLGGRVVAENVYEAAFWYVAGAALLLGMLLGFALWDLLHWWERSAKLRVLERYRAGEDRS